MKFFFPHWLWIICACVWLCLLYATQYFSQPIGAQPAFQFDSDLLVSEKLRAGLSIAEEFEQYGGFMHLPIVSTQNTVAIIGTLPYQSQVGAQGIILHAGFQLVRSFIGIETYLGIVRIFNALLLSSLVISVMYRLLGRYGLPVVAVAIVLVSFMRSLTEFSTSIYWMMWLQFLPFAIAVWLYPRVLAGKLSFPVFCVLLSFVIYCKCLTGYEYITNVIAAPSVAIFYYGFIGKLPAQRIILHIVAIGMAGCFAFVVAVGVHLIQGAIFNGSLHQIIEIIRQRTDLRTSGVRPEVCSQLSGLSFYQWTLSAPMLPYLDASPYTTLVVAAIPLTTFALIPRRYLSRFLKALLLRLIIVLWGSLLIWYILSYLLVLLGREVFAVQVVLTIAGGVVLILLAKVLPHHAAVHHPSTIIYDDRVLGFATAYAFVVSVTWIVLAQGHTACHFYLNGITFQLPFGLLMAMLISLFVTSISRKR